MLTRLLVRNYAVADEVEITLGAGLTVLSGETGAGKSILIDALGLLLGDRADSGVVRAGEKRAELEASFDLGALPAVREWLETQTLDDPDQPDALLLRRVVTREGQSRATINGNPSPLKPLRELGAMLVGIHGQHAHQRLSAGSAQRDLLDGYGGHQSLLEPVAKAMQQLQEIERELRSLDGLDNEGEDRIELLRYQCEELDQARLTPDELEPLEAEFRRLDQVDQLLADCAAADQCLDGDEGGAYSAVAEALRHLRNAVAAEARLGEVIELCEQAEISLKEAAASLHDISADLAPDPERLAEVRARLDLLNNLARKHRVEPGELCAHHERLAAQLEQLSGVDARRQELRDRREQSLDRWRKAAAKLSAARGKAAGRLGQDVTETLHPLGLPHARFEVMIETDPDAPARSHGADGVQFCISMNPGQDTAPLARAASGGELSRTALALQVVCLENSPVPVLLFDEVDAGVGGAVAEMVGQKLRKLGERYQVLCVTHQPQVAAQGHAHFAVRKDVVDGASRTTITPLDEAARVDELARMLGGVEITAQTTAHAKELLERVSG